MIRRLLVLSIALAALCCAGIAVAEVTGWGERWLNEHTLDGVKNEKNRRVVVEIICASMAQFQFPNYLWCCDGLVNCLKNMDCVSVTFFMQAMGTCIRSFSLMQTSRVIRSFAKSSVLKFLNYV